MYFTARSTPRLLLPLCILALLTPALSASAAPPLKTPWVCEETFPVSQAHNTGSHMGKGAMAWDFALPLGTAIVAPAPGKVRLVRQDSTSYGCDPSYAHDSNYVIIEFGDGTEGLFMHLEANSSPLQVGDHVKTGDLLGRIGMSGYTCGPHLHFQVQETCDSWWCASVPASFIEYGDPHAGQELASNNCSEDELPGRDSPKNDRIPIYDNSGVKIVTRSISDEASQEPAQTEPSSADSNARAIGGSASSDDPVSSK